MFPFIPHIYTMYHMTFTTLTQPSHDTLHPHMTHSPLSHDYHMTCTTHSDCSLAVDHPDLGVRGELEETVVEERERRVELQHLTLQWKH